MNSCWTDDYHSGYRCPGCHECVEVPDPPPIAPRAKRDTEPPAPPTPLSEKLANANAKHRRFAAAFNMVTIPAEELRLLYCVVAAARSRAEASAHGVREVRTALTDYADYMENR